MISAGLITYVMRGFSCSRLVEWSRQDSSYQKPLPSTADARLINSIDISKRSFVGALNQPITGMIELHSSGNIHEDPIRSMRNVNLLVMLARCWLTSPVRWFQYDVLYLIDLGASVGQVGLAHGRLICAHCVQIIGGWLSDTIGRLRAIAIGSSVAVFGYLIFFVSPSREWVLRLIDRVCLGSCRTQFSVLHGRTIRQAPADECTEYRGVSTCGSDWAIWQVCWPTGKLPLYDDGGIHFICVGDVYESGWPFRSVSILSATQKSQPGAGLKVK